MPGHTWKPSHECVSTVCAHTFSLAHMYVCVHTDTGKRYNTPHALLLLSTALYLLHRLSCLSCLIRRCTYSNLSLRLRPSVHLCLVSSPRLLRLCFSHCGMCRRVKFHSSSSLPRGERARLVSTRSCRFLCVALRRPQRKPCMLWSGCEVPGSSGNDWRGSL